MIGLIVGCMPILPAFFRQLKSNGQNLRKGLGSSVLSYKRTANSHRGCFIEPHLLGRDNLELADLENRGSFSVAGGKL